jgi:heme-degrading monooxygenase HmoA
MVTTVGMYYDVVPGQGEAFRAKFAAVAAALAGAAGHRSSHLYQRVDAPDSYAVLSEWDDPQAFGAFIRSAAFREVTAWGRDGILRAAPRHKVYPRAEEVGGPPGRPTPPEGGPAS